MSHAKVNIVYLYIVFYILWGWFFKNTIYSSSVIVYSSLLIFYAISAKKIFSNESSTSHLFTPMLPFFGLIVIRYLFQGNLEFSCFWLLALAMICKCSCDRIADNIPYQFFVYSSLFCVLGVLLQLTIPSWFNSHISTIYLNDNVELWATSEYGIGGFTYQLATTAEILIIGECVLLANVVRYKKWNWIIYAEILLIVVCVFLTGKRMNSLISVLIIIVAYIFKKKIETKRILPILFVLLLCYIGFILFINNSDALSDNQLFRRLAGSASSAKSGGDLSNGRDLLWAKALSIFKEHTLIGIGPGRFPIYSGMDTDVHNIYIQTLCEQGIFGFVLFVIAIIWGLVTTLRTLFISENTPCRKYVLLSLLLQIVYIVEGYSENMNTNLEGYMIYAIAIAIMLDCKTRLNNYEYTKDTI